MKKTLITLMLALSPAAWAASPASGEINDTTLLLEYAGSGPFVLPNVTGTAADPICEPTVPQLCDVFTLNVNISDEFRMLEANQRETVTIGMSFAATTGTEDLDLYVADSSGAIIGSAQGSFGVQESVVVPLKTLKNGTYTVTMVPFTPMGANYDGEIRIGKGTAPAARALSIAPQAGTAPLTVQLDARGLAPGAASYVFEFGDGSAPVTDADGVIEHTYTTDGHHLAKVRIADASGTKTAGAAQTVAVGGLSLPKADAARYGGAFGASLLGLLAFGVLTRRRNY